MIGRGQVEAQHPEDRPQKALRLTKGQVKDQAERQRGFDGNLGVLQLPSARADAHGLPRGDRFRRQPQGDVASLDQCSVVRRPVSDAVFRFVPGMHSRLHVESMPLRPSRWPGPATNTCYRAPTPVKALGRRRWKKASGYHQHARVEHAFFRYTSIVGDCLRARSSSGQRREVVLACNVLNRMTELGRPVSYRIGR